MGGEGQRPVRPKGKGESRTGVAGAGTMGGGAGRERGGRERGWGSGEARKRPRRAEEAGWVWSGPSTNAVRCGGGRAEESSRARGGNLWSGQCGRPWGASGSKRMCESMRVRRAGTTTTGPGPRVRSGAGSKGGTRKRTRRRRSRSAREESKGGNRSIGHG